MAGGVTVINDAAYLGKMTVTTDFLGIHGYYKNDDIVIVPKGNATFAAEKIKQLMKEKQKCYEIAKKARERVKDFNINNFYSKITTEIFTLV